MTDEEIVEVEDIDALLQLAIEAGRFKPGGIYYADQIPNALYHRGPGISSTNLKNALISPLHYKTHKQHPKPSTPAMMVGTMLHELVLEPDTFLDRFVLAPKNAPLRPTDKMLENPAPKPDIARRIDFWAAFDEEHGGKQVIKNEPGADPFWAPGQWDLVHLMRDAIMSHPFAPLFLERFNPEVSVYWMEKVAVRTETGEQVDEVNELCKARFDIHDIAHELLADLKTGKDVTYTGFQYAIRDFGYHVSREHYMRGALEVGITAKEFLFICIEKEPPYPIGLYRVDEATRHLGRVLRKKALEAIAAAHHFDVWPSYPPHDRELITPPWFEKQKVI